MAQKMEVSCDGEVTVYWQSVADDVNVDDGDRACAGR
jgi:hypothetical protein